MVAAGPNPDETLGHARGELNFFLTLFGGKGHKTSPVDTLKRIWPAWAGMFFVRCDLRRKASMKLLLKKITLSMCIVAGGITAESVFAEPIKDAAAVKVEFSVPKTSVLSFLEWKSMRVHEAQQKLETAGRAQGAPANVWQEGKPMAEVTEEAGRPSEQKLNFNVDVALQLNIHDYFSIYLKKIGRAHV